MSRPESNHPDNSDQNSLGSVINEHVLTAIIDEQIKNFAVARDVGYSSFSSAGTDQNFSNLDKYCSDLVSRLDTCRLLALEVKVRVNNHLPAYKKPQHIGLKTIEPFIPALYYCYNSIDLDGNVPAQISVSDFQGARPSLLPGRQPNRTVDQTLEEILSFLLASGDTEVAIPFDEAVFALFVEKFGSSEKAIMAQLTTKALLLIYNPDLARLVALDIEAAQRLIKSLKAQLYDAPGKSSAEFQQNIDKLNETINANLKKAFEAAKDEPSDFPDEDVEPDDGTGIENTNFRFR